MRTASNSLNHSWWHTLLFFAGVIGAFALAQTNAMEAFIQATGTSGLVGSFIIGFFFTSVLTVTPATVAFFEIGQTGVPLLPMALAGGLGAVLGDLLLYHILRVHFTDEVIAFLKHHTSASLRHWAHLRWFSWVLMAAGAIVLASPLPDELGLALMGLSRVNPLVLIPISFVLNSFGIFFVGLLGQLSI